METRWLYNTPETLRELREASNRTCVIPMGCVEKHGLHLPLGTDIIHASAATYEASKLETFCVFPDFTFGDVPDNAPTMPMGSIGLPVTTQMLLLEQLCEQISRHGFNKIVVLNGHGGNVAWLNTFMRKLSTKKRDFVFAVINMGLYAPHKMAERILEKGEGAYPELTKEDIDLILKYHGENMLIGHACFGETALIMGIAPESVRLDRLGIESGHSTHKADYLNKAGITMVDGGWGIDYPNAYAGDDPVGCNERIGKAALRHTAERIAEKIRVIKHDENLLKWQEERQRGW